MIRSYTGIAFENIRQRKLRSSLTTLGVVISVASIIILLLVSDGLKNAITEQFDKLGSQRIYVSSASGQPGLRAGLTTKDLDSVERIGAFSFITPFLIEPSAEIQYGREKGFAMIIGYPDQDAAERFASYDLQFAQGRAFNEGEKNGVILGDLAARDLFDKEVGIHNSVLINDQKFTVIGILKPVGNAQDDQQIYIPLDTARTLFSKPDEISFFDLTVKPGLDVQTIADRLERQLKRDRDDDNFRIMTPTQILRFLTTTLAMVQGVLVSIATISLGVGALGIMNMMFTAVLERTKEIGVMKSIGARNSDVLTLFMLESGIIGLAGGVVGVILGAIISLGIGLLAAQAGFGLLSIRLDYTVLLLGIVFALLIGMVAGYLPARRAALLHPVDALRWSS